VPEFAATMTFEVVYRAKPSELTTGERAYALAETMLAVLRGGAKYGCQPRFKSGRFTEPFDYRA